MSVEVKPEGSMEALDQFIAEEAKKNSGIVSFGAIDGYINTFRWGFFVVDNDPAHEDPHPVDEHLMMLQSLGKVTINMKKEQLRVIEGITHTPA